MKGRITALVLVAGMVACGGGASSPEGAARNFVDALDDQDTTAFYASFTDETADLVRELEELTRIASEEAGASHPALTISEWCTAFCGSTVEGATLHGDSATVTLRVGEDGHGTEELPVVRTDEGWRIDLAGRFEPAVRMLRMTVRGTGPEGVVPSAGPEEDAEGRAEEAPADTAGSPAMPEGHP